MTDFLKLLLFALIMAGCSHVGGHTMPPTNCPCASEKSCVCDWNTGDYSFSDGCNTINCNKFGLCSQTLLYCPRDWRKP